jgi:hypothetical protein
VVIEEVQAGAADSGGRTPFRPDTPRVRHFQAASDTSTTPPSYGNADTVVEHVDAAVGGRASLDHSGDVGGLAGVGAMRHCAAAFALKPKTSASRLFRRPGQELRFRSECREWSHSLRGR